VSHVTVSRGWVGNREKVSHVTVSVAWGKDEVEEQVSQCDGFRGRADGWIGGKGITCNGFWGLDKGGQPHPSRPTTRT